VAGDRSRLTVDHPSVASVLSSATLSATLGTLPMFLVGALAIFIRADLGFGESALGAAASLFYFFAAVGSPPGGRLAERLGERPAMAVAAAITFASCLGFAWLTDGWLALAICLVLAGISVGIAQPASSLALVRGIPFHRQGMAFGLKQSSGAFGTLLGGLSVPLIGLTVGWRWAFLGAALLCLPLIRVHRSSKIRPVPERGTRRDLAVRPLRYLSVASLFAVMGTSTVAPFYVESAVAGGIRPALAGTLFAVGSVSAVVGRLIWGHIASLRTSLHFWMIAVFQALGAASFVMLAFFGSVIPLAAATILLFAGGWGWPGLLTFAIVSRSPEAPAVAAGIVGSGQFGGGIFGPLGFGLLVEATSYRVAWLTGAALLMVGATLSFIGGRSLDAALAARTSNTDEPAR
jgi:MFS family permease